MKQSQYTVSVEMGSGLLMFHSLLSSFIYLDENERSRLEKILSNEQSSRSEDKEFIEQLKSLGFLVDDFDEFSELEQRYWDFRNSQEYIKVVIAPTTKCNFSCAYCFEQGVKQCSMSTQTVQNVISKIRNKLDEGKTKGLALIWYGGEPLLEWEIIHKITSELHDYCIESNIQFVTSVITNGFLLSDDMIRDLKRLGCSSIQITLDGDKNFHNSRRMLKTGAGTYDKIFDHISECYKEISVTVRVNIDKQNLSCIKSMIDRFVEHRLFNINLFFAPIEAFHDADINNCYSIEEFAPIQTDLIRYSVERGLKECVSLPKPKFGFCEAVSAHNFLFDPDGDHFLCWENVGKKELTDSSTNCSDAFSRLQDYYVKTYSFHKDKCTTCSIFPLCLGGCPQKKLDMGEAPCPTLYYNLKDLLKIYYNTKIEMESE